MQCHHSCDYIIWYDSSFAFPKKDNAKKCSNYRTIVLISHASKVMRKILQARLQQYVNCELTDVQGFRKGRGTRNQIANICWIIEKARRVPVKHLLLLHWLHKSLWLCESQHTGKFFKRWEYQITWHTSWEICMQVKMQLDMSNGHVQVVPNWERSMSKLYIV